MIIGVAGVRKGLRYPLQHSKTNQSNPAPIVDPGLSWCTQHIKSSCSLFNARFRHYSPLLELWRDSSTAIRPSTVVPPSPDPINVPSPGEDIRERFLNVSRCLFFRIVDLEHSSSPSLRKYPSLRSTTMQPLRFVEIAVAQLG